MRQPVLELEKICKEFPKQVVLRDVNLMVHQGEFIAIIGPSGCGKSTLLHIAGLLDLATSGNVRLLGHQPTTQGECTIMRRHHVGFVYQFHHLLPEFTVLENLYIPAMIAGQSQNKKAWAYLDQLGLKDKAHAFVSDLSGGEQQRVAIARSLINNPSLVLADEPTGNLDEGSAGLVYETLLQGVRSANSALVMVTHDMRLAQRADSVWALTNGVLGKV